MSEIDFTIADLIDLIPSEGESIIVMGMTFTNMGVFDIRDGSNLSEVLRAAEES